MLDEAELRVALRRTLRVPPSIISDPQISSLMAMFDKGDTGQVSVNDLVDFLGANSEVSKRTGKSLHGPLMEQANMVGTSGNMPRSSPRGNAWQNKAARPHRPPLKKAALEALRIKIKSASYTGVFGRQLDVVFGRFDKDGSGQLDDDEVRQALRRVLRIPPSTLSDAQIVDLCAALDTDHSGAVSIQELVNFVGAEAEVSARTGKKVQGMSRQTAELLEEEGLPQVHTRGRSLLQAAKGTDVEATEEGDSTLPPVSPGRPMTAATNDSQCRPMTAANKVEPGPAKHAGLWPDLPVEETSQSPPNSVGRPLGQHPQVLPNLAG